MTFINFELRKRNHLMIKNDKNTKNWKDLKIGGDEEVNKESKLLSKSLMISRNFVKKRNKIQTKYNYLVAKPSIQMAMRKDQNSNYLTLRSLHWWMEWYESLIFKFHFQWDLTYNLIKSMKLLLRSYSFETNSTIIWSNVWLKQLQILKFGCIALYCLQTISWETIKFFQKKFYKLRIYFKFTQLQKRILNSITFCTLLITISSNLVSSFYF